MSMDEKDGLEVCAYERRWSHDGEVPAKVKNENGRMAWPFKFKLKELTKTQICRDDQPLCSLTDAQRLLSQLREELAQRDAEVERLRSYVGELERLLNEQAERIATLESHQAASVGEARPTGLSRGWNLVRQCDGFVIGHSSNEPPERYKQQALADGRVYVPFMVAASVGGEREAFEGCWAVRGTDDEGNIGNRPLRSLVDQHRYRGDAVNGSWVWFQRGAAYQRAALSPAGGALLSEQPQAGAGHEVEQQIVGRYTVHPTGRGFWPYCVRAGDGERELFIGHKRKCDEVAAALQAACLDGAFMQATLAQPAARHEQGDDSRRIDFLEKNPNWLRYHKGRYSCVRPGTNYSYPVFPTARQAIDAALTQSPKGEEE